MSVTKDLKDFGNRELAEAGELFKALHTSKDKTEYLGEGVEVWFNLHSGYVFLCDEDCNVALMNGENLEDFLTCGNCGTEGFMEDIETHGQSCCHEQFGIEKDGEE